MSSLSKAEKEINNLICGYRCTEKENVKLGLKMVKGQLNKHSNGLYPSKTLWLIQETLILITLPTFTSSLGFSVLEAFLTGPLYKKTKILL